MATQDFEILDHTADVGIRAFGTDRRTVYRNAARGLISLIVDPRTVRAVEEERLTVRGNDPVDLLVAWLHEILYRFDAQRRVYAQVDILKAGENVLRAVLRGEPFDSARHEARGEIKAVTWHGARVERTPTGWVAEIFLDV